VSCPLPQSAIQSARQSLSYGPSGSQSMASVNSTKNKNLTTFNFHDKGGFRCLIEVNQYYRGRK
jgi:hypothetical protein